MDDVVVQVLSSIDDHLASISSSLAAISESLERGDGENHGPNYQRPLAEYPAFDWETIGAEVVKCDQHGATLVAWRGDEFSRRRHADYDASIWFSRYTGQKDENDRKVYARLITFTARPRVVKSLPDEVSSRLPPVGATSSSPSSRARPASKTPASAPAPAPASTSASAPSPASDPVTPTQFWGRVNELRSSGQIPDGVDVRAADAVQKSIASGDFRLAMAWLESQV